MYNTEKIAGALASLLLMYSCVAIKTDFFDGRKDPFGPYPRIPDKEKLKKELAFAAECKKHTFPPKEKFFYD
ncbi:PREDICTED: uncharacterized protein LOC106745133 [Dinoponera quadriceps]|uniref:Uncharacterized protein LOC106745133 n=1 Tax=Dinoponera quadriceps TaxID=609295 RepID=A0A6P3XDI7_DINQU|nr:PREDICTED: uncharacterized protein LOC106745133 [Dinoponera quadriceps]